MSIPRRLKALEQRLVDHAAAISELEDKLEDADELILELLRRCDRLERWARAGVKWAGKLARNGRGGGRVRD